MLVFLMNDVQNNKHLSSTVREFINHGLGNRAVEKIVVMEYKQRLIENYAPASANSMLSSINSFFEYMEWYDCKVKTFKIQKQIFANKDKELTKSEYERLLVAAKKRQNKKLYISHDWPLMPPVSWAVGWNTGGLSLQSRLGFFDSMASGSQETVT